MCHPDIEIDFEVKNDTKIESLQKMLDNLYDTYSKDENDKKSSLKIKKKSEQNSLKAILFFIKMNVKICKVVKRKFPTFLYKKNHF